MIRSYKFREDTMPTNANEAAVSHPWIDGKPPVVKNAAAGS